MNPIVQLGRKMHDGDMAARRSDWASAAKLYTDAMVLQSELVAAQSTRVLSERVLHSTYDLPSRLAGVLAMGGDLWGAIAALENGRGRLLSEGLMRQRLLASAESDDRLQPYSARLRDLAGRLDELEVLRDSGYASSPEGTLAVKRQLTRDLLEIYSNIRRIPGYETYGVPADRMSVRAMLRGRDVAYLSANPQSGFVLYCTDGEPALCELPQFDSGTLAQWATRYVLALEKLNGDFSSAVEEIDIVCQVICSIVAAPLLSICSARLSRQPLYIVACSWFSVLPIHAAWEADPKSVDGRQYPLVDRGLIHVPNAQVLRALPVGLHKARQREKVIIVADPVANRTDLPASVVEAHALRALWSDSKVLWSKSEVLSAISECSIVHFATHGVSRPERPLASALSVGDEWIAVSDLLRVRLRDSVICVLSACETGAIGRTVPDEATGLVTGLLAAGATGVIASAWAVDDLATCALMIYLHKALKSSSDWVNCLTAAQNSVRFATLQSLRGLDSTAFAELEGLSGSRPFSHPYYWAGFYYSAVA